MTASAQRSARRSMSIGRRHTCAQFRQTCLAMLTPIGRDRSATTQVASVPEILVVVEGVPARTLAGFIALAKAQPGFTFALSIGASTGLGGMPHLAAELLKTSAGIELVRVAYPGAATTAIVSSAVGHRRLLCRSVWRKCQL